MKKKSKMFEDLKASLNEAIAFADGTADVAGYRIHIPAELVKRPAGNPTKSGLD